MSARFLRGHEPPPSNCSGGSGNEDHQILLLSAADNKIQDCHKFRPSRIVLKKLGADRSGSRFGACAWPRHR